MSIINKTDMQTFALMNNISINEAKKLVGEKISGSTTAECKNKTAEVPFTDTFISTAQGQKTSSTKEELSFYENFFATTSQEEKVSQDIENMIQSPELMGKSKEEIRKYFANTFDIFEEDAAEIFNDDFIDAFFTEETSQVSLDDQTEADDDIAEV